MNYSQIEDKSSDYFEGTKNKDVDNNNGFGIESRKPFNPTLKSEGLNSFPFVKANPSTQFLHLSSEARIQETAAAQSSQTA